MSTEAASPRSGATGASPWVALIVVLAATFVQLLDVSIVNVAIPSIQQTLHAAYADVQLVLSGYQLGFAATLIIAARLGDIYGRRRLFLIGMICFALASVACGAAATIEMLVISRVVQGIASALMFSQVLAIIQVMFAPRDRGGALGAYGATIGLGTILGPVAGGALIQIGLFADPWRAIFLVNVPICAIAVVAALRLLGESTAPTIPRLDIPGAVLSAVGLGCIIYPLSEGRTKGWPLWLDALLAVGVALLAVFLRYERGLSRAGRSPILDTGLFADRAFRVGAVLLTVFNAGVPAFFFAFNVYLQQGEGFSALASGLATVPFALGAAVTATTSDDIATRIGNRVLLAGSALLVLGMLALILTARLAGTQPQVYHFIPAMLLGGLGYGLFIAPAIDLILANVRRERAGAASGALPSMQQVGSALGVALIGIIFFGLLGGNAPAAATGAAEPLRASLAGAGLPTAAVAPAAATFERCFIARSTATDPTVAPPGCAAAPTNRTAAAAFVRAGREAGARTFTDTLQQALLYEVGVFALAFLLALRLPKVDPVTLDVDGLNAV